ncbi:hypothetical protein DIPPA_34032 [Diplonema papillatum]|nr:hypothetical protein DIPPA_34032 [Diplonema papillatum]
MTATGSPPSSVQFQRPIDVSRYLVGAWKRSLEERDFGGTFQFQRTSNLVIHIREDPAGGDGRSRVLHWTTEKTVGQRTESRIMYSMTLTAKSPTEASIAYDYEGAPCEGRFVAGPNALVMTHVDNAAAVVSLTYRILDGNTMALSVAECDSTGPSRLLTGLMHRIDLTQY